MEGSLSKNLEKKQSLKKKNFFSKRAYPSRPTSKIVASGLIGSGGLTKCNEGVSDRVACGNIKKSLE